MVWWRFGCSALELIYVFANKLGIEVEVNMEAVGRIRKELRTVREELHAFRPREELPEGV